MSFIVDPIRLLMICDSIIESVHIYDQQARNEGDEHQWMIWDLVVNGLYYIRKHSTAVSSGQNM
jgi:hypothetical protein